MKRTFIALSLIAMSGAAFAAGELDFTALDTDANGSLSLVEIQVALPDLTEEAFKAADVDASGELSAEEVTALTMAAAK